MKKRLAIIFSLISLTGCSSGEKKYTLDSPAPTNTQHQKIALNQAQTTLYQEGVLKILPQPETADFLSVKAMQLAGLEGVHVCGYVAHKKGDGNREELPFYVELREEAGTPIIHRGQLGTDASKTSKIKFVCRHHEGA